jgi:creatinine amidohydrolase/Fe(II)-dependent formamide hydrolase-like protein
MLMKPRGRSLKKIAERLGNALVAPVISYVPEGSIDPPTAHMKFPGTTTITDKTFEQMLESAARSFKRHGFKTIVLIGYHGSYQADCRRLNSTSRARV